MAFVNRNLRAGAGKEGDAVKKREICMVYFDSQGLSHPRHMAEHFAEMRDLGADSVFTQFLEEGSGRWLAFKTRLAHDAGLKVYAAPGRIAGVFSAGPRPGSMFALQNPDTVMRDEADRPVIGVSGMVCCVNQPKFQAWFYPLIKTILMESNVDGVAFDEPKEVRVPCWCPVCRSLVKEPTREALVALREDSMAAMLGRVGAMMKQEKPGFTALAMLLPHENDRFIEMVARQSGVDTVGVDGPLSPTGTDPAIRRRKKPLLESAPRFVRLAQAAGKRAFVLAETFDVQSWACPDLAENLPKLADLDADIYGFNYYPHDNDDPEAVMNLVRKAVLGLKKRAG